MDKNNKVVKYKKSYSFSIGFIIIGVMFIYMVYHMFTYLTTVNPTIYEVTQGTISSNKEYNALAIRQEEVVTAEKAGNILYLSENFGKVSVKSDVYALDETGDIITNISLSSLSDKNIDDNAVNKLSSSVSAFTLDYNENDFYRTYGFKSELERQLEQLYNLSAMSAMEEEVNQAQANGTFYTYKATKPGLVVYSTDGMEGLTLDNFTKESFDATKNISTNLKSQESVISGQSVYKIITSDKWNLICEIDGELANSLRDERYIEIKFLEDETNTWTRYEIVDKHNTHYLVLYLDDSMDRYADLRFIHIKLLDQDITGLKIPNSSITYKDFYTIPKEYFYQGDDSSNAGVTLQNGMEAIFKACTIYYETDDMYYIDTEDLNTGDILIKGNSSSRYIVGSEIASLKGVYCVNKGYAQFKQIEVLYENEDYSIIRTGTRYGIAMYDHIILQGDQIEENTIIN
ncbi:MAG: hypothetical protein HUJ71_08950 [Pseudobutyrivibrio sp.]|nr:hypothetical protein [Pseudobutyrivibrio sp.]